MIPKIIHYCWFGGKPLPELAQKCIESWKKYCPDYEIRQWNEENFDVNCCAYVQEAYQAKKYAFVTDYVRLYAMVTEGGVYMDTDVEVLKPLGDYLSHAAFSGFEQFDAIPTGIMASEKGFPLFGELLADYSTRHFRRSDGTYDVTTNVTAITESCLKHGLQLNNTYQVVEGFALYPCEYFCPKSHKTGKITLTDKTVTIHHFAGTWHTRADKLYGAIERKFADKGKVGRTVGRILVAPVSVVTTVQKQGFRQAARHYMGKLTKGKKK